MIASFIDCDCPLDCVDCGSAMLTSFQIHPYRGMAKGALRGAAKVVMADMGDREDRQDTVGGGIAPLCFSQLDHHPRRNPRSDLFGRRTHYHLQCTQATAIWG